MSIVKPIASRRSMVHRLMINPPIVPEGTNLVHKGTAVEISRSTDFTKQDEIVISKKFYKEDDQDILTIKNTIMVSPDEVLYARYAYILGTKEGTEGKDNYKQEKWSRMSSTHGDQVGFKFDDNILATPQIAVSDYDNQVGVPQLKVSLDGYKVLMGSIGNHKYTTWEFTDTDNNVIYSRIKDEDNLTSILVSKDLFKANKIYFIRAKVFNSYNGESNYGTYVYNTGLSTNVSYKLDILKPVYYGESINIGFEPLTPSITGVKIIVREANGDYELPADVYSKRFDTTASLVLDFEDLYNGEKGPLLKPEATYKFYAQLEYTTGDKVTNGSVDYIDTIRLSRKELYPNRVDANYTGKYHSLSKIELGPVVVNSREFKDGTFILGANTYKIGPLGDYTNELILYTRYGRNIRGTSVTLPLPLQVPAVANGNNNLPIINVLPMYTDMVMINYATFDVLSKNFKKSVWVLFKVDLVGSIFKYVTHAVYEDEYLSTAESSSAVVTKDNEILYIPHGYGIFSKTRAMDGSEIPGNSIEQLPAFFYNDIGGLYVTGNYVPSERYIDPSTLVRPELVGRLELSKEDEEKYYLATPSTISVKDKLTTQTGPDSYEQFIDSINMFQCDGKIKDELEKVLGVIKFEPATNLARLLDQAERDNGLTIDFYFAVGNNVSAYLRESKVTPNLYTFTDIEFFSWGENVNKLTLTIDSKKTVEDIFKEAKLTFSPDSSNNTITITEADMKKLKEVKTYKYHAYCTYKNNKKDLTPFDRYYLDGLAPVPRMTIVFHLGTEESRGQIEIYANGTEVCKYEDKVTNGTDVVAKDKPLLFKGHEQPNVTDLKKQLVTVYFNSIRFYTTAHDADRVKNGVHVEGGVDSTMSGSYSFQSLPLFKLSIVKDTEGPKPVYKLQRTQVVQSIKTNITRHMTIVPNRGSSYTDKETYLILGGTTEDQKECTNGAGGNPLDGMYYFELSNLDVLEYDPSDKTTPVTLKTYGQLPQELKTFDERTASFYNISAQRRFDGKIVLFNNSVTSRYTGLATDTTTWLLDPDKKDSKFFVVNEQNDTTVDYPFRSTVVRNNGDILRIAYSTTQQCSVLCYPADPAIDGVIDTEVANRNLVIRPYERLAIDNPYIYDSITIEGDSLENTGSLTWIDATRTRTFNCFDRIITKDTTETQSQADSKKKERLFVLDNVKYKIKKD